MKRLFAVLVTLALGVLLLAGGGTATGEEIAQEPQEVKPTPVTDENLESQPSQESIQTMAPAEEKRNRNRQNDKAATVIVGITAGFLATALLVLWGGPNIKQKVKERSLKKS